MKNVLLLGGTGALGEYLVEELINTNYSVYITSRTIHNNYKNIHFILGNAKEESFLKDVLKTPYDCIVDFMVWPTEVFKQRINKILSKTDHYIYLSSYRAYANADMSPLTETSPLLIDQCTDKKYLNTDEYALAKGREERILHDSIYQNYTIVRPAITFSKTRFQIGTLEASTIIPRTVKKQPLLLPKEMLTKYAAVSWAGDIGRMLAYLLGKEKAKREVFNIATAERHTWGEIASYYHEIIGTDVILCDLTSYIDVVRGEYQVRYDRMFNRIIDNSKILNFMNLTQRELTPIKTALKKELSNLNDVANRIKEDKVTCDRMDNKIRMLPKPVENYFAKNNVKDNKNMITQSKEKQDMKVGILNFHFANNYGAVLVPFAMIKIIEKMGYKVEIINYVAQKFHRHPAFVKFRGKYLSPISKEFTDIEQLKNHHDYWNRVVVGSDQVWRMFHTNIYMLEWVFGKCSLISYAASYGHDLYEGSIPKSDACALLHRFDAISVREKSGVDICKNDFDVIAVQVLDPTLLLSASSYEQIIKAETVSVPEEDYVCCIFLNSKSTSFTKNPNILLDIRSKYKIVDAVKNENNQFRPVGEWLSLIKNSKYVITDSFHGTVFSIIFNKQFITVMYDDFNGNSRIPSLLETLGIKDRIVFSLNNLTISSFNNIIDYTKVNTILQPLRNKSFLFLKNSLSKLPTEKDPVSDINAYDAIKVFTNQTTNNDSLPKYYKKWIELKLAEIVNNYTKNNNEVRTCNFIPKRKFSIFTFCIYWMYRVLFRISFGKIKSYFKNKRAYYRYIVKGR